MQSARTFRHSLKQTFQHVVCSCIFAALSIPTAFAQDPTDGMGSEPNASTGSSSSLLREKSEAAENKKGSEVLSVEPPLTSRPIIKMGSLTILNSDQITHREDRAGFGQGFHHGLIRWYGGEVTRIEGKAEWLHFKGMRYQGHLDLKPAENWYFISALGGAELALVEFLGRKFGKERHLLLWKLRSIYTPVPETELRLEANNDFSYMGWLDRQDQGRIMPVDNLFAEAESFSFTKWQLRTNARKSTYSDSNSQEVFDHLILRELMARPFVMRFGAGGGWLRFQKRRPGYWNPEYFETYGMRLILIKDLTPNWNIESRFHYGLHREKGRAAGKEGAAELHVQYRNSKGWMVKLIGGMLDSDAGAWWRRDVSLSMEIPI